MENVVKEDVLQALTEFGVKSQDSPIPSLLEEYLHFVASTGDTVFPWTIIKVLVRRKIEQVLCDFLVISSPDSVPLSPNVDPFKYAVMREKILEALEYFTQAPFTIQRLCEVIVDPKRYYKRIDKLMRAFEKNLLVTTTVEPRASSPYAHETGIVNGFDTNGHHIEHDEPINDIIGPSPAPEEPMIIDCPIPMKAEDETGDDIDVEQASETLPSRTSQFDLPESDSLQASGGRSSQENLLQIQLQIQEQEREQVIPPVIAPTAEEQNNEHEQTRDQEVPKEECTNNSCNNNNSSSSSTTPPPPPVSSSPPPPPPPPPQSSQPVQQQPSSILS